MKKAIFYIVFVITALSPIMASAAVVDAFDTTVPVVSIGANDNDTTNTGPLNGSVYNGTISVFATVMDDNLENYHFRVVKNASPVAWGSDVCTELGTLFELSNQGYASTTLGNTACGFAYNQSVYESAGFTNKLIATLDTRQLSAYQGDGEYLLILAARDAAGNRNSDFANDVWIKIIVDSSAPETNAPITTLETTLETHNESVQSSSNGSKSHSFKKSVVTPVATTTSAESDESLNVLTKISAHSSNLGVLTALAATTTYSEEMNEESQAQLASIGFSNVMGNWYWYIAAAVLLAVLWFFTFYRNNQE